MKIAFLVPDNRENARQYELKEPYFGTAPTALMQGFTMLSEEKSLPIEVHVISCTQRMMPAPEKLGPNIWFHSLHVPKWGWLRGGYLGCAWAVRRKLAEIQPDIVHAQGTERDCAISAILSPYPKLLTIHGNLRQIKKQVGFRPLSALWFQTFLESFVIPRFGGVICITNYTRTAVENEVPRTWLVPNAVSPEFLSLGEKRIERSSEALSQKVKKTDEKPFILVVGSIDSRKNQIAFIKSLDSLVGTIPFEVRFFGKCGDDEYGSKFKSLVSERPWCHYEGILGREELKDKFAVATLLALPTNEDNCPMVVLEAQAAGVPVIASNVGGIPDLIEDGETGLLLDPNNTITFMNAVERLLSDQLLRDHLAFKAYKKALNQYHPLIVAGKHREIYQEVCGNKVLKSQVQDHG